MLSLRRPGMRLIATWLSVAVFFSAQNILVGAARHRAFDWQWDVYHEFVYALTWAAFSLVVLGAGRRWRVGSGQLGKTVGPHLLLMLALAPAQIVTTYTLHYLGLVLVARQPGPSLLSFLAGLESGIVWGTLTGFLYYWLVLGVQAAFVYQRMYREQQVAAAELQADLSQARLDALRLQLHPHFLFNTLNAIGAFVQADPGRAQRMIVRLGDLLRRTLNGGTAPELPLREELEQLTPYLEIQRIRFGERLSLEIEVSSDTEGALVPTLLLQPLVENAVEHGVKRTAGPAQVRISARREGHQLRLEIADNGPGLTAGREGVGLANTRSRLSGLYGDAHSFALGALDGGGTLVAIDLPFREQSRT